MDCSGFDTDASVQVIRRFIELRDPQTRDLLLPWLLDQSKVSPDQAHLVEEVRRVAVSDMAERLREGNKFCGPKQTGSKPKTGESTVPYPIERINAADYEPQPGFFKGLVSDWKSLSAVAIVLVLGLATLAIVRRSKHGRIKP